MKRLSYLRKISQFYGGQIGIIISDALVKLGGTIISLARKAFLKPMKVKQRQVNAEWFDQHDQRLVKEIFELTTSEATKDFVAWKRFLAITMPIGLFTVNSNVPEELAHFFYFQSAESSQTEMEIECKEKIDKFIDEVKRSIANGESAINETIGFEAIMISPQQSFMYSKNTYLNPFLLGVVFNKEIYNAWIKLITRCIGLKNRDLLGDYLNAFSKDLYDILGEEYIIKGMYAYLIDNKDIEESLIPKQFHDLSHLSKVAFTRNSIVSYTNIPRKIKELLPYSKEVLKAICISYIETDSLDFKEERKAEGCTTIPSTKIFLTEVLSTIQRENPYFDNYLFAIIDRVLFSERKRKWKNYTGMPEDEFNLLSNFMSDLVTNSRKYLKECKVFTPTCMKEIEKLESLLIFLASKRTIKAKFKCNDKVVINSRCTNMRLSEGETVRVTNVVDKPTSDLEHDFDNRDIRIELALRSIRSDTLIHNIGLFIPTTQDHSDLNFYFQSFTALLNDIYSTSDSVFTYALTFPEGYHGLYFNLNDLVSYKNIKEEDKINKFYSNDPNFYNLECSDEIENMLEEYNLIYKSQLIKLKHSTLFNSIYLSTNKRISRVYTVVNSKGETYQVNESTIEALADYRGIPDGYVVDYKYCLIKGSRAYNSVLSTKRIHSNNPDLLFLGGMEDPFISEELNYNDISWDHYYDRYDYNDNLIYGWVDGCDEGYFSSNSDYVYSEVHDQYFMDPHTARDREFMYSDYHEDWVPDNYNSDGDSSIKSYSYKPSPIFKKDNKDPVTSKTMKCFNNNGNLSQRINSTNYYGVELEINHTGDDSYLLADKIQNLDGGSTLYCKSDSSLSSGFEIVSHPLSLKKHKKSKVWRDVMSLCRNDHAYSYKGDECGIHVHVGKQALSNRDWWKLIMFFEHNKRILRKFSQRSMRRLNQWAKITETKNHIKNSIKRENNNDIYKSIIYCCKNDIPPSSANGRYSAINVMNITVEFRLFRGTTNIDRFLNTIGFVDAIVEFVKVHGVSFFLNEKKAYYESPRPTNNISTWEAFSNFIRNNNQFRELDKYLTKKNLVR